MKKWYSKKTYDKHSCNRIISILIFFLITSLSLGYSALSTSLKITGDVSFKYVPILYEVFKSNVSSGLVREYTGSHQDSMNGVGSNKIYHWYAENDAEGQTISNMNNVLFGNKCWKMYRTTDTGGVRLSYNGEAENGKCLNTRGNHLGFDNVSWFGLDENMDYYFADGYTYDSESNTSSLTGNIRLATWNSANAQSLIGSYTCKSSETYTSCADLYYITDYRYLYNGKIDAQYVNISNTAAYDSIGKLSTSSYRLGRLGYMYNSDEDYSSDIIFVSYYNNFYLSKKEMASSNSYYYADNIVYGNYTYYLVNDDGSDVSKIPWSNTNRSKIAYKFTCLDDIVEDSKVLENPKKTIDLDYYTNIVNDAGPFYFHSGSYDNYWERTKNENNPNAVLQFSLKSGGNYILKNNWSSDTISLFKNGVLLSSISKNSSYSLDNVLSTDVFKVEGNVSYSDLSFSIDKVYKSSTLSCKKPYFVLNSTKTANTIYLENNTSPLKKVIFASSYSCDNDNCTLNNPVTINLEDYYLNYLNYNNYYYCDSYTTSCNNNSIKKILQTENSKLKYSQDTTLYKFGSNVSYSNGKYKVLDVAEFGYDYNHRYSCLSADDECSEVIYVLNSGLNGTTNVAITSINYFILQNGEVITDYINRQLSSSDVNINNSALKKLVEDWFKNNMFSYSRFLEDTVFCNNRSIFKNGYSDANSSDGILFLEYNSIKDLSCSNITDKFSVNNNFAKNSYPVGLITRSEVDLLNNKYVLSNSDMANITMSPTQFRSHVFGPPNYNPEDGIIFAYDGLDSSFYYGAPPAAIHPVISLKPFIKYNSGDGTMDNPYVVR